MKKSLLIQKITNCNLSQDDKIALTKILNEKNPDYNKFLTAFFQIMKVGSGIYKLFDIDIGEFIKKLLE